MSRIDVVPTGPGTARITHHPSGAVIDSASPPELGGPGGAFSSTDLLAAALGSCIASSVAPVARRAGIADRQLRVSVEKRLTPAPRVRVASLRVAIGVTLELDPGQRRKLLAAAASCPVHRSLAPTVEVTVTLVDGLSA